MNKQKLRYMRKGAIGTGQVDHVHPCGHTIASEIFAIPSGLSAQRLCFEYQVSTYVRNLYIGICNKSFDGHRSLIAFSHRVGIDYHLIV